MAVVVNKVKATLHLGPVGTGGVAIEHLLTDFGAPLEVNRDSPGFVLSGERYVPSASYARSLSGTALLDWQDPAGGYYWVNGKLGTEVEFTITWENGPTQAGTLILDGWAVAPLKAGTSVQATFTWPITSFTETPAVAGP